MPLEEGMLWCRIIGARWGVMVGRGSSRGLARPHRVSLEGYLYRVGEFHGGYSVEDWEG